MALQSNYYPVPIVAGTTAGTYAAGDDPRLSDERTPPDDAVTNAKLANVATATIKGRATAGTGDPEDLSASQVRTILNVADGATANTASSATPQALGVAAAGTSSDFSRADHVHAMPSAADVGAATSAQGALADTAVQPADLATVATSGDYDDLTNKPTLGTAAAQDSTAFAAASHTHAASDITSGTLTHERGGLEANVSAYNGLVKISGGSTSAVGIGTGSTEVAAGDHGHGNINSSGLVGTVANLPLKTGTGGIVEAGVFGTGAGEFAEGNHTHADLHTRSHAITSTSDHTAGNHKVFYSNGSGEIVELALGNSGEVLTSNGATSAPSFAAASGGVSAVGTSAADILSVSGSDLVADDPNADRLVMYDDSASKLTHATAGKGLSFDGTTLNSATAFPVDPISRGATFISYLGHSFVGNSSNTVNGAPGYFPFSLVYVPKSANYTTFTCIVSVAGSAGSVGKMALYTINAADALPNALVCESGTFAADSTGIKQPTMASTFVSEGWYYMAIGTNSTTNMNFTGDTMASLRGKFAGSAGSAPVLLDYSRKAYADLWPNPWDGTESTFRNANHPITSLT